MRKPQYMHMHQERRIVELLEATVLCPVVETTKDDVSFSFLVECANKFVGRVLEFPT